MGDFKIEKKKQTNKQTYKLSNEVMLFPDHVIQKISLDRFQVHAPRFP